MVFAVLCSTNFTFVKVLEVGHSESAVGAVRFAMAAIPFLPLVPQHLTRQSIVSGVELGLWCFLAYVAQAIGLPQTEASKGAFLCSLTMVVVPVVKSFFGERVKPQIWAAVILALFGTGMLLGVSGTGGEFVGINDGEAICLLTAFGFGMMFARMDEYAKEPGFNALGCTVWQIMTLAVAMFVWLLVSEGPAGAVEQVQSLMNGGPTVLSTLFWVGIVTTGGVHFVETWAMEQVDATEEGIIFASEPVWGTLFAAAMLHETFGLKEGCGGLLILLSCLLTQVQFGPEAEKRPQSS